MRRSVRDGVPYALRVNAFAMSKPAEISLRAKRL